MGLFNRKDWNVIAVIFERTDQFQINGNRGKGKAADAAREGARKHARTVYWAVFDQKGAFLEGGPGPAAERFDSEVTQYFSRELIKLQIVRDVLRILEQGEKEKYARSLPWTGVPS